MELFYTEILAALTIIAMLLFNMKVLGRSNDKWRTE